jgi:hypothetical protein
MFTFEFRLQHTVLGKNRVRGKLIDNPIKPAPRGHGAAGLVLGAAFFAGAVAGGCFLTTW